MKNAMLIFFLMKGILLEILPFFHVIPGFHFGAFTDDK